MADDSLNGFSLEDWWNQDAGDFAALFNQPPQEPAGEAESGQEIQHTLAGRVVFYRSSSALQLELFLPAYAPGQIRRAHGFLMLTMCPSTGQRNRFDLPQYDWRNQKIAYKIGLTEASKMLLALMGKEQYDGFHVPQPRGISKEEAKQKGKSLSMRLASDGLGYMVTLRHQDKRVTFILDPSEQLQVRLLLQAAIPRMAGWAA